MLGFRTTYDSHRSVISPFGLLAAIAALTLACGDDGGTGSSTTSEGTESGPASTGASATESTSVGTATAGSGPVTATAGGSEGSTAGSGTAGSAGSTGAGSATASTGASSTSGGSGSCGGSSCGADEWCDDPLNMCGAGQGQPPSCEPRPAGCPDIFMPVCGCDGMVYTNECEAQSAGVDVDADGQCEPPPGGFPCGPNFCQTAAQYCLYQISDVVGEPDFYACVDLPAACQQMAVPTCDCLAMEACGDMCSQSGDGLMLTCPGG